MKGYRVALVASFLRAPPRERRPSAGHREGGRSRQYAVRRDVISNPSVRYSAAAVVSLVILKTGIEILRESSADLMNILPEPSLYTQIYRLVHAVPGVRRVEEIRVHRLGISLLVNVVIGVDGTLSVAEGDRIASDVERTLLEEIEYLRHISVHFHPDRTAG